MKTKSSFQYLLLILSLGILLFPSCKNSSTETIDNENETMNKETSYGLSLPDTIEDTEEGDTMIVKKVFEDTDTQESHQKIVKKYGQQWDLCRCIEKSDSVNKALMNASDEDFDNVMKRSDYIDNKCKDMLIHPNETPDERYEYQKKVNNCLEKAKK